MRAGVRAGVRVRVCACVGGCACACSVRVCMGGWVDVLGPMRASVYLVWRVNAFVYVWSVYSMGI